MIESDYYQNYQGPNLMKATLNDNDITELILEKYGQSNNWNGYFEDRRPASNCDPYKVTKAIITTVEQSMEN